MNTAMRLPAWLTLLLVLALVAAPGAQAAGCPKTSLPAIQDEVMCLICGVPLANAGGPSADDEREFIRGLAAQCKSKQEIKAALVGEYGEGVLAMPPKHGFGLAAYLVPVVVGVMALLAVLFGALGWRRARARDEQAGVVPAAGAADAEQSGLDEDLRRYDL
jgi:cytochrome c-type biogenesis protein CcmH